MMQTVWFVLVAFMLTAYVVLDGFDLGTGALYLIAARSDAERRTMLRAIGPVWDGNEVWLLAAGGTLFYAFPLLYASSFSGFYLPLCFVLWLIVFRAIGIEFRMHVDNMVWREFFDGVFAVSSVILIVLFGAALGNVLRGVPLGKDHYFFVPLWTNFMPGANPGVLDWYTMLCVVMTVAVVSLHGALYVAMKTTETLQARMARIVKWLWPLVAVGTAGSLAATVAVRPRLLDNYRAGPAGWAIPAAVAVALAGMFSFTLKREPVKAFLSSCLYIVAMLSGAAFALYPALLPSSADAAASITIWNAAAGPLSLSIGLIWWSGGMALAIAYFALVYTMFRGKVSAEAMH